GTVGVQPSPHLGVVCSPGTCPCICPAPGGVEGVHQGSVSATIVFSVDQAFIVGGKPAIVAVWMITSCSSSGVSPAFRDERRCTGSCEERPVATSAATE